MAQTVTPPQSLDNAGSWLLNQVDTVLNNTVNQPMETLFEWLFPLAAVGLTIQFVVYAFLIMQGNGTMTVTEFFKRAILAAIVASFFGVGGFYQTDIAGVLLALPDDLSRLTVDIVNIGQRIDDLQMQAKEASAIINSSGEGSWFNFLPSARDVMATIMGWMLQLNVVLVNIVITVIMIICKVGMALIVATGPFAIAALLFTPTKNIFNSWVAQALNYAFLALLSGLLFGLMLELNMVTFHRILTDLSAGTGNLMAIWGASFLIGISCIFIMLQIPSIAAALSGGFGAQLGVGAAASAGFTALRISSLMRAAGGGRRAKAAKGAKK